jgi:hypothetical protein
LVKVRVGLLTNTDWNLELAQGDIDELWNRFANKISSTYKDNIPVSKSMTKKFNTPWILYFSVFIHYAWVIFFGFCF